MISVTRTHEICAGHRVVGHEGKCKHLHGHNYTFELTLVSDELDAVGRVIDFGIIKSVLCQWVEDKWDHRMLLWSEDPIWSALLPIAMAIGKDSIGLVKVPFNPTAENIAMYFCEKIAPGLLEESGVRLIKVTIWETSKCSATYEVKDENANTAWARRENVEAKA